MQPKIDLIAVAFQARNETTAFLQSLKNVDVPFTLTIIDNCSPDQTVRDRIRKTIPYVISQKFCVDARFIENKANVGYARAVNQGALLGNAPFLVALNCDTKILPSSVSTVVQFMEDNPKVGVAGPKMTTSLGRLTHSGIVHTPYGDVHRNWQENDIGQADDIMETPSVSGAAYFARRKMWEELTECPKWRKYGAEGAFLPTRHFWEETACSYHARSHGWKIFYLGTAKITHEWQRSSPPGYMDRYWEESKAEFLRFCKEHGINYGL